MFEKISKERVKNSNHNTRKKKIHTYKTYQKFSRLQLLTK